jgi:hypothetical protein
MPPDQSAIQQDVQQDVQLPVEDVVAKQKTARELMLEEIENRHTAELAAQNGYNLEADPEPEPAPAPAIAATPEPDQLAAQLAAVETPAPAPSMVKIKVDGVEQDVPLDDVVRQYQKNSSADKRLAEATRLLREAQETAAQRLLEAQQAQQLQQQVAPAPQPNPVSAPTAETGKEFLKALFEGDEDNALAKLQELTAGRQAPVQPAQPTLDINEISNAVAQHVQQKLAVESALAKNRADYPQLYADPDMEALALAKIQRIRESDGSDFFSALDTVSQEFANKFGWNQPAAQGRQTDPAPPTTSKREAKLERKSGIDNVVSITTKTTTSEPQPESPSDIIAQMRAARAGG